MQPWLALRVVAQRHAEIERFVAGEQRRTRRAGQVLQQERGVEPSRSVDGIEPPARIP